MSFHPWKNSSSASRRRQESSPERPSQSTPSLNNSKIFFIRKQLNLNAYPFRLIPDDFILLLFTSETDIQTDFQSYLYAKYGHSNYESFEFIGDTVLNFIVIHIMIKMKVITSPDLGTKIKNMVTKNQTLGCLLDYKFLCNERTPGSNRYEKSKSNLNKCADVFEAIIGGLYWYLDTELKLPDAISVIEEWLTSNWPFKQIIFQAARFNKITCPIPSQEQLIEATQSFRRKQNFEKEVIVIDDDDDVPPQTASRSSLDYPSQMETDPRRQIQYVLDDDDPIIDY